MPDKQTTAGKRARALQRTTGKTYTEALTATAPAPPPCGATVTHSLTGTETTLTCTEPAGHDWHKEPGEGEWRPHAETVIAGVRKLHRPAPGQHPDFCAHDKHKMPCPTIAALDNPPED